MQVYRVQPWNGKHFSFSTLVRYRKFIAVILMPRLTHARSTPLALDPVVFTLVFFALVIFRNARLTEAKFTIAFCARDTAASYVCCSPVHVSPLMFRALRRGTKATPALILIRTEDYAKRI